MNWRFHCQNKGTCISNSLYNLHIDVLQHYLPFLPTSESEVWSASRLYSILSLCEISKLYRGLNILSISPQFCDGDLSTCPRPHIASHAGPMCPNVPSCILLVEIYANLCSGLWLNLCIKGSQPLLIRASREWADRQDNVVSGSRRKQWSSGFTFGQFYVCIQDTCFTNQINVVFPIKKNIT